jgi:C4-dicarboxylate-specific signal transduction histidine kinase
VNDVIEPVLSLMRREFDRYEILVQTELTDGLPEIIGDPIQLQQVMLNLLVNAIEATAPMSVGTRIIRVESRAHGANEVAVAMTDSGAGIPPPAMERLFDPFYTTKTGEWVWDLRSAA